MNPPSTYDERELFFRIAQGSEEAFTALFHLYAPKLYPFIRKLTRSDYQAREMIQETFLRLWMNRSHLTEVSHPSSWIYAIASNVSLTWLKTHGNRLRLLQKIVVPETSNSIEEELDSKELNLVIRRAVNKLPALRQKIYRLSREEGLSHRQIAEKLNLSQNTVKNQIGISLKFIGEFISKETGLSLVTIMVLISL